MHTDPDDLYNCDETGLLYRLLPEKTLSSKHDEIAAKGFKACKDRLTVLVTCNATGTDKQKLLVIGNAARPRCFRSINQRTLPVHWRSNSTAWMNTGIFTWWLTKCFVPDVRKKKRDRGKPADAPVSACDLR
jgi:hypothetical protein